MPFKPKQQEDECPKFAKIEIAIFDDGTYTIKRSGANNERANAALEDAARAMQLQIIASAQSSS